MLYFFKHTLPDSKHYIILPIYVKVDKARDTVLIKVGSISSAIHQLIVNAPIRFHSSTRAGASYALSSVYKKFLVDVEITGNGTPITTELFYFSQHYPRPIEGTTHSRLHFDVSGLGTYSADDVSTAQRKQLLLRAKEAANLISSTDRGLIPTTIDLDDFYCEYRDTVRTYSQPNIRSLGVETHIYNLVKALMPVSV